MKSSSKQTHNFRQTSFAGFELNDSNILCFAILLRVLQLGESFYSLNRFYSLLDSSTQRRLR